MDDMYDYIIFPKKEMGVIDCFSKHLRCLHKRLHNVLRDNYVSDHVTISKKGKCSDLVFLRAFESLM